MYGPPIGYLKIFKSDFDAVKSKVGRLNDKIETSYCAHALFIVFTPHLSDCSPFLLSQMFQFGIWCCKKQNWSTHTQSKKCNFFCTPFSVCSSSGYKNSFRSDFNVVKSKIAAKVQRLWIRQASEASIFLNESKYFCERSEQALRRSYQNLARSANFLLVNIEYIRS